jgi:hypothetical protein
MKMNEGINGGWNQRCATSVNVPKYPIHDSYLNTTSMLVWSLEKRKLVGQAALTKRPKLMQQSGKRNPSLV